MCMGITYSDRTIRRKIKEFEKKRYVKVYKIVDIRYTVYAKQHFWTPYSQEGIFNPGINVSTYHIAHDEYKKYCGFHFIWTKDDAKRLSKEWKYGTLIECLALPEWIIDLGHYGTIKTGRATHLYFPTYPEKTVKVKEFRKAVTAWKQNRK